MADPALCVGRGPRADRGEGMENASEVLKFRFYSGHAFFDKKTYSGGRGEGW